MGAAGKRLWASLADQEWIAQSDLELLRATCALADEIEVLRAASLKDITDWRLRLAVRAAEGNFARQLGLLGGTSADRARLGFGAEPGSLDGAERRALVQIRRDLNLGSA